MTTIADTGVLLAILNANDQYHEACVATLAHASRPLLVPTPVLAEVCYMVESRIGSQAEAVFLRTFPESFTLVNVTETDLARMADLVEQYSDLPLGGVDACVVAIAERLGVTEIATLDRRDFMVVRPGHVGAFTLLPA